MIVWLNCWGGRDTQPQVPQAFSGQSMHGDEIAWFRWPRCALWERR